MNAEHQFLFYVFFLVISDWFLMSTFRFIFMLLCVFTSDILMIYVCLFVVLPFRPHDEPMNPVLYRDQLTSSILL